MIALHDSDYGSLCTLGAVRCVCMYAYTFTVVSEYHFVFMTMCACKWALARAELLLIYCDSLKRLTINWKQAPQFLRSSDQANDTVHFDFLWWSTEWRKRAGRQCVRWDTVKENVCKKIENNTLKSSLEAYAFLRNKKNVNCSDHSILRYGIKQ